MPYPPPPCLDCHSAKKIFGVEEGRPTYRLRQARYYELGYNIAQRAGRHYQLSGKLLNLLDIGTYDGVLRRYTEIHPGSEFVRYNAVDIYPHGIEFVYKYQDWNHYQIDLNNGLQELPSESFDMVVCEQVLEHLQNYRLVMSELSRILQPNGYLVIGVPIFLDGLHWVRKHVVPVTDVLFKVKKIRGHIQAWSKRTFLNDFRTHCPEMKIEFCRGFRVISGGFLRPLEYCRSWWQWNRWIGKRLPSCCIEIQIAAQKQMSDNQTAKTD